MSYTFNTLPDWVFSQVYTYTAANRLKDNQEALKDAFSEEHDFTTSGIHKIFRQSTLNQLDGPAPVTYGGNVIVFEAVATMPGYNLGVTTYTKVVIDDSIDWRDRKILFVTLSGVADTVAKAEAFLPGGGNDHLFWAQVKRDIVTPAMADWDGIHDGGSADLLFDQMAYSWGYSEAGNADDTVLLQSNRFSVIGPTGAPVGVEAFGSFLYVSTDGGKLKLMVYRDGNTDELTDYAVIMTGLAIPMSDENHI